MIRAFPPGIRPPLVLALAIVLASPTWAANVQDPTRLTLEELMSIEVSSASKKPQTLGATATAMHVINRDDIRRSGASTLPELLRLVPGVQVSRIDASRYAITIRGFASRYAGKLLVLQDGRTLYSPLFNGTFWEVQDVVLDDIERIEVIRGPGGTMWGANAVNGVINIITRAARDTQGTLVQAQAGNLESGIAIRHGGTLGEDGHFRAFAKLSEHDALQSTDGTPGHDALRQQRAGFRIDLKPRASDRLTLQGDVQAVDADVKELSTSLATPGVHFAPDTQAQSGVNLLVRWEREVNANHHWHLQAYVDRVEGRSDALDLSVNTVDLELQQRLRLNPVHELTWGAGWRHVSDKTRGSFTVLFDPPAASGQVFNAFVQDEMTLSDTLRLTLGSKFEHNETTGLETQPSARLHWRATPTDTVWAAVSRAVETPSRSTLDSQINYRVEPPGSPFNIPMSPFPMVVGLRGNPDLVSQELVARELGYRGLFGRHLSLDLTVFHNRYERLVTAEGLRVVPGMPSFATYGFANGLRGHAHGIELSGVWQVQPGWRLSGSLSTLRMKLTPNPADSAFGTPGASPSHLVQLHSQHDLGHNLELDAHLYRNGKLPDLNIPAHTRLDLRLGWRVKPGLEISLTGRNLLQRSHAEFRADDLQASEIPRSWLLQARWKF
jgi:iron complex outermembrane receptor protein